MYHGSMLLSQARADFLEYLTVERNRSPKTIVVYTHYLDRFATWLRKDMPVADITAPMVRKYRVYLSQFLDERGEPLDVKTQSYHVIALRSFLKYCIKQGIPCLAPDQIELPKVDPHEISFLTDEELEKLLETPDVTTMGGLRDRAIMELFFSTGLRVSELAALNQKQLNTTTGEMRVVGKGRKERIVFISERARGWMEQYLNKRLDDLDAAFAGYRGKGANNHPSAKVQVNATRLTPRSIERIIEKHALSAGLVKKITPHSLRHSFATDLLLNGADIRSVQSLLGHASITTTQIYTHITNQQLREVHQKFHGKKLEVDNATAEIPGTSESIDLLAPVEIEA